MLKEQVDQLRIVADQRTYKAGTLAYYDTLCAGLVPCKVLHVEAESYGFRVATPKVLTCKITEDRGPYRKGEIMELNAEQAPPRDMVRRTRYTYCVCTAYKYVPD